MRKTIILALFASCLAFGDDQPKAELSKVDAEAKAAWYKAIAILQSDLAAKSDAQLTINRVQAIEQKEREAVSAAFAKLCGEGFAAAQGQDGDPKCVEKPKPAAQPAPAAPVSKDEPKGGK